MSLPSRRRRRLEIFKEPRPFSTFTSRKWGETMIRFQLVHFAVHVVPLLISITVGITSYRLLNRYRGQLPSLDWEVFRIVLMILFFPLVYLYLVIRDGEFDDD